MVKLNVKLNDFVVALKQQSDFVTKATGILNSVLLKVCNNDFIELCATDGNLLSLRRILLDESSENINDVIDNKYIITNYEVIISQLNIIAKTYKQNKNLLIQICIEDNNVKIIVPDAEIKVNLFDGNYPKYEQLINQYNTNSIDMNYQVQDEVLEIGFNKELLIKVLKNMSKTQSNCVKFSFDKNCLSSQMIVNHNKKDEFTLIMPMQLG